MSNKKKSALIFFLATYVTLYAQKSKVYYQNVRGQIKEAELNEPIPGVIVAVKDSAGIISATTDSMGRFLINLPTGRQDITFSYIGHKTIKLPVLVTSGKEVILDLQMEPVATLLNEVNISARRFQKDKTINSLIYASGRSFSIEEAYRYAGTLGDPARMVRSYAGVIPERDDRNDIVIRGNSPTGILWRLDGIEIPNPNHYGGIGLTGNTITLLNINMLSNSDFITGAFPSEYGNALSGVFDLKMRNANTSKREYWFQTGWNGFELGAEGPFTKEKDMGSYLLCYRYSFLGLLNKVGINFGVLPQYQDFTFKTDINLSSKDKIKVIGLWGTSFIQLDDHTQKKYDISTLYGEDLKTGSDLFVGGLIYEHRFSNKTSLNIGISAIRNVVKTNIDTFNLNTNASANIWDETSSENKYSVFSEFKTHNTKSNLFKLGMRGDVYDIDYKQQGIKLNNTYGTIINTTGQLNLLAAYLQNEYKITPKFYATAGVRFQYLMMNNATAIEPRGGLKFKIKDNHTISFSYGNHHQMQPRTVYFIETQTLAGSVQTNRNLDFSAAHHFVLSYDWLIAENLRFKTETYYQGLYNIPVRAGSTFSMLNQGANFYIPIQDSLVNKGTGRNYGLEITLEKFFANNYYYMINASVFQSEYTDYTGVWRSTAFNSGYIFNAMGGYEFWKKKNTAYGIGFKTTYAGGKRYTPVNETASTGQNVVYDDAHAYEKKFKDYFRADIKIFFRVNFKKAYLEEAVDFQNVFNTKNIYDQTYNPQTGKYNTFYQMSFFPMVTVRCLF